MRRSPADSTNRSLAAFGKLQYIRLWLSDMLARHDSGRARSLRRLRHGLVVHHWLTMSTIESSRPGRK